MHWSGAPDVGAFTLLALAFASIMKRSRTHVAKVWMVGWAVILLHFLAILFSEGLGLVSRMALVASPLCLIWAALLFMGAAKPYHTTRSFRLISASAVLTVTFYAGMLLVAPWCSAILIPAAALIGLAPLAIAMFSPNEGHFRLRLATVTLFALLSIFLLCFNSTTINVNFGVSSILLFLYFGCGLHLWRAYPQSSTGSFVTITGFLFCAVSFVLEPIFLARAAGLHLNWNLPLYVVAVGMMLLLLEEQIAHNKYLALHDELTALPNRRLFQDRLSGAIARAQRSNAAVALLLIDLDDFKQVNDQYGHAAGDAVLRHVSRIFSSRVRKSDTVARTGGDEFCIILESPTSREDAEAVGQALLAKLAEPLLFKRHKLQVGASIGLAVYPEDGVEAEELNIAADNKMYQVKRQRVDPESQRRAEWKATPTAPDNSTL